MVPVLSPATNVDHCIAASDWLSSHGEKIRVIQLRGTVAFANVAGVLVGTPILLITTPGFHNYPLSSLLNNTMIVLTGCGG